MYFTTECLSGYFTFKPTYISFLTSDYVTLLMCINKSMENSSGGIWITSAVQKAMHPAIFVINVSKIDNDLCIKSSFIKQYTCLSSYNDSDRCL